MTRKLFGTDGVRGLANAGAMSPETAFRIGAGIVYQLRKKTKHAPRVVIGKDTRLSGYLLETALSAGVCTWGGRVMLSGRVHHGPTIGRVFGSMRNVPRVVVTRISSSVA